MADKNTFQKHEKAISNLEVGVEGLKISMEETKANMNSMGSTLSRLTEFNEELKRNFTELMSFLKKAPHDQVLGDGEVISFCAALGFMIYGGRLFIMLRRFPIESRGRQKKLHEVGFVTGICCTCFLIRCFVVALSAFDEHVDVDVLGYPILDLIFYAAVEILPSALVLFILRKLPPRRVSDQYHPIS